MSENILNNKKDKALTLTIIAKMTSNYSESLGNVSSIQKVFRSGKTFAIRSRESLKNAIMTISGMYDDIEVVVDGAAQKQVDEEKNASNCRALEGGYMKTSKKKSGITVIRKSSFYLTDAVACDEFDSEARFHNNLYLASKFAKDNGINVQSDAKNAGLMPYQYEYDKSLKQYSITIDLDKVGVDENFNQEASGEEKAARVNAILEAVRTLSLVVKGNLDNAEPIMVFGGIGRYKTHYFENVVRVKRDRLDITKDLESRLGILNGEECAGKSDYKVAMLEGGNFENEEEILERLKPMGVSEFFDNLEEDVRKYYE